MRRSRLLLSAGLVAALATPAVGAPPAAELIASARAAAARASAVAAQAHANGNDARAIAAASVAQEIRETLKQDLPAIKDAIGDPQAVRAAVQELREDLKTIRTARGHGD